MASCRDDADARVQPGTERVWQGALPQSGGDDRVAFANTNLAGGKWVAVRTVATSLQRPDAYAQFYCSPCLMAQHRRPQLALPLQDGDVGCRWFGGLGDYLSVRKMAAIGGEPSTISPDCCRYLLLSKNAQDRYDVSLDNEESET
jgi:hypothetical protein